QFFNAFPFVLLLFSSIIIFTTLCFLSLRPPISTLFPYTTLFRSNIFLFILHRVGDKPTTADLTSQVFFKALTNLSRYQFRGLPLDRKSTRLNSSHVKISYAVFCLKKKKKYIIVRCASHVNKM